MCFKFHKKILDSMFDDLTQTLNKKPFFEKLTEELERAKRGGGFLAFMVIDIDDFKAVNDTHGHDVGDLILKAFSDILRKNMRKYDVLGRIGGEEFAIIASDCPKEESISVAERIRKSVEDCIFPKGVRITASIGISNNMSDNIFRQADKAMYESKDCGKNKVVFYENEGCDS